VRLSKSFIKRNASRCLVLAGFLFPKRRVPVLAYHSVDKSGSVISISPTNFRRHMEYLRYAGYQTLSLKEYFKCLDIDPQPSQKKVVLTFDDGFKNNYTQVFPILCELGFTATIFLATDYVAECCSWEKHKPIPPLPLLSWDEIRQMSEHGIEFSSHTCSHPYLTQLGENEIRVELLKSKSIIEDKIHKKVDFFAHPYGDTDERTQRILKECGYLGAFGGVDFSLANSTENLYDLKRLGTAHFSSLWDLRAGLLGTYHCYIKAKGLLIRA
jgi:peptidoglycan/xylan/chitin deacetylase (PgdA/CDA1 family)